MKPRVLFVIPPLVEKVWTFSYDEIYLGAAWIAAHLEQHGVAVSVVDCAVDCRSLAALQARIRHVRPHLLAVPVIYGTLENAYRVARLAHATGVPRVVFGGLPATFAPERVMAECPHVDVCVRGEGEVTMLELILARDPALVSGLVYRDDGRVVRTPDRPLLADLDQQPLPARHLFPLKRYRAYSFAQGRKLRSTTVETKRGCAYACTFCTQAPKEGRRYRLRSPEHVVEELRAIHTDFPFVRRIMFVDNDFFGPVRHGREVLEQLLGANLERRFEFMIATRIATFRRRDDLIDLCDRANVRLVYFGVESVSDPCRETLGKIRQSDDLRALFERLRSRRIHSVGSYIFGFENETMEDMEQTIQASFVHMPSIVKYNVLTPYPGTDLYDDYQARGLLDQTVPLTFYDNVHQVIHHSVDLEALFHSAYRRFYFRPTYLAGVEWTTFFRRTRRNRFITLAHHAVRREMGGAARDLHRTLTRRWDDPETFLR